MTATRSAMTGLLITVVAWCGPMAPCGAKERHEDPARVRSSIGPDTAPEDVIAAFEAGMYQALRNGAGEIGHALLLAAGEIEHLGRSGAPDFEILRAARAGKVQSTLAAMRSVREINAFAARATESLRTIDAPAKSLEYVAKRRSECAQSMWDTGAWAHHLIDDAVIRALSGD